MAAARASLLPASTPKPAFLRFPSLSGIRRLPLSIRSIRTAPRFLIISSRYTTFYTEGSVAPRIERPETEPDDITALNQRIRREHKHREGPKNGSTMDSFEVDKYIRVVKEQQQRGLQKLKGDKLSNAGGFGYQVDPYTLNPGDYVVHKKVGIGKFVAIKFDAPKDSSSGPIEYVFIEYADGMAKLPVKQASRLLYRYNLPNETRKPRALSKLSDPTTWQRRRTKGKIAVQKMVVDLMELYLHRLKQKRLSYPKSPSAGNFAAQFPYEPTPDQKQAFIDVERDLTERGTPMDRLICGDVGFGKTEVAMRAIFCVVSAGKQAMVLTPTIVLAKQHFVVISQRFSQYPHIKIGLLSRFQTKSEKEEYLSLIKSGHLDIIVGTHALLGNRVAYNNLGLLVVDEEQRFGVKQKEKIASFKTAVDVLTLSATPIPRTLYLALTGFRDASLISTPPPERVRIKTQLSSFSKEKILSAIKFELDRGGQVFYVLPRIKGLEEVRDFLEDSFPCATIAIAHGKLRGRVGRSDKEAYAYLFFPDKSLLSDQAAERLAAIEDFGDLGKGFYLAERDMGIRGFGNIFGEQQTGDIGNVGIDLFFEMLFESLSEVDKNRLLPVPYSSVQLDINLTPHLSSDYINYLDNPVELIKEAERAAANDIWRLMQFTEQLRRQYGKEPHSMEILLKKLYVRRMAADLGIKRIYTSGKTVVMITNMSKKVFRLMTESMTSDVYRNSLSFTHNEIKAELLLDLPKEQLLNWIFQCLAELYAVLPAFVKY
ncbi:ATP-dependent DNA helicase At3g02060, chloroplastic-like isoform X2 [Zingiber officinale]|uniref:ATP-dependent DNA helicase At3g02060, chloroplastic-like isoform X2 n=1 Tax=Zingiber officinale TaxID=94328 RepID=UPI001C4C342E|nr:ATP-dependent DNA helicase At3g02060, chloroplastic-like isoform X2 [Zingiber officinale]